MSFGRPNATRTVWAGRFISTLCVLFLLVDAGMKLMRARRVVESQARLGFPEHLTVPLGIVLLAFTILYAIPQTCILGAILVTGCLGFSVAAHVRVGDPFYISVVFGVLMWGGLYLREQNVRPLIPLRW